MKAGIITFHFAANCGAILQCLALSESLKRMGHEVCVINYQPGYHTNRYKALRNPFYFGKKNTLFVQKNDILKCLLKYTKGFLGAVFSWRYYAIIKAINLRFKKFSQENLNETILYRNLNQLKEKPPECDVYISGSDQVWNTKLTNAGLDTAYFLDFGGSDVRRISYAAGVDFRGMDRLPKQCKELLRRFQAVSLREEQYESLFRSSLDTGTEIHIDLDPTLLLKSEDYTKFMAQEVLETEPYVLTYTMQDPSQKEVYKAAIELAGKRGIKIIDISNDPKQIYKSNIDSRICGPEEFLWYIKHAQYVLTNSFHSTVFSLIFETNFVVVPHSQTGYRVTELLDKVGMGGRCVYHSDEALKSFDEMIDFQMAKDRINVLKEESVSYLRRQILAV